MSASEPNNSFVCNESTNNDTHASLESKKRTTDYEATVMISEDKN